MPLRVLGRHKRRVEPSITLYIHVFDMNRQGLAANCERDLADLVACLLDRPRPTTRIKPSTGLHSDSEGFKKRYKIRFDRISGHLRAFQRVQQPTACALLRAAARCACLPPNRPAAPGMQCLRRRWRQRLKEPAGRQCEKSTRMQLLLSSPSAPLQHAAHVLEQASPPSLLFVAAATRWGSL